MERGEFGEDEEQRFEAQAVPWTADMITDAPTVSITSPGTMLHKTKPREGLLSIERSSQSGALKMHNCTAA